MIIFLYFMFLLLLAVIGTYHWFYMREIKKTTARIGFSPSGAVQGMIAVNNVLVFGLSTFVIGMIVFNFLFGI